MEDYSDILSEIAKKEKLIVFAGSGVPTDSGLPMWKELLKKLKTNIEPDFLNKDIEKIDENELPQLAQEIYERFVEKYGEMGKQKYLEALREILIPNKWSHSACQLTILNTFDHIVTTNFDSTFEKAIEAYNRYGGIKNDFQRHCLPILENTCFIQHKRNLVYLHGNLADNVIFKKEEYERFYNSENSTMWEFLKPLYEKHSLVFIGFSFQDSYIKNFLVKIYSAIEKNYNSNKEFSPSCTNKPACIQHYAFLRNDSSGSDAKQENFESLCRELENINIKVMKYKEHADYEDWLNALFNLKKLESSYQLPWSPENG